MSEKHLADAIRRRIGKLGINKQEVAIRAGISRVTLDKLLNGQTRDPGLKTIINLAEALHVSPSHFIKTLTRGYNLSAGQCTEKERFFDQGGFVRDISIPDNTIVTVNQTFEKIWEIQNNGNVAWENRYLKCMDEKPITSAPASPDPCSMMLVPTTDKIEIPVVKPGEVVQLKVSFQAPAFPCTTFSYWKMVDMDESLCFPNQTGVWCLVKVVST